MASLYFAPSRKKWMAKWRSRGVDGTKVWNTTTLCDHPGWSKGMRVPRKAPPDVERLFRKYQDLELQADHGVMVASVRVVNLADFLAEYVKRSEAKGRPNTLRLVRRITGHFRDWCEEQGVTTVAGVKAAVCMEYLESLAKTRKWSSVATHKQYLSPAWSYAIEKEQLTVNPWRTAKLPGRDRRERPPYWTEDQFSSLLSACSDRLRDIASVAAGTGLRISALLALDWSEVDFASGVVRVRAEFSKSGKPYSAPMIGRARDVLQRLSLGPTEGLVFPAPRGGQRITSSATFRAIKAAAKRAGIPLLGHYNHILRHSFATWAINRGVPIKVVSQWMGHSSVTVTEIYAHADARETQRWADFLSDSQETSKAGV